MADTLTIDAALVRQNIDRLKADYPELLDDAELLETAIDGETDFERVLEAITDAFLDATTMKGAIADRMSALKDRGERFDRKAEAMKGLALSLMTAANKRSIRLPAVTLSIAQGRARVVIENERELPQGYFKAELVPLKTDILAALQTGDPIPGARLEYSPDYLTIRTK